MFKLKKPKKQTYRTLDRITIWHERMWSFVREGDSTAAATIFSPGTVSDTCKRFWSLWRDFEPFERWRLTSPGWRSLTESLNTAWISIRGRYFWLKRSFREPIGSEGKKKKNQTRAASSSAALPDSGVLAVGEKFPLFFPLFHFKQRHIYLTQAQGDWNLACYGGDTVTQWAKTCWCS